MDINSEVILLKAVYEHIDEMVNYAQLKICGTFPNQMVMFHDTSQRKLFYVLLVDFLSASDDKGPLPKTIFLKGLSEICDSPNFTRSGSEADLKKTVSQFRTWLNEEKKVEIWMPSIDTAIELKLTRAEAIKMSGDVSKHNYLRSIGVAQKLQQILSRSGLNVSCEDALLALPDFYGRFGDDILIYLSSHICEFLNNIRWGIYDYLLSEYKSSYICMNHKHNGEYSFTIPKGINTEYAQACYWDLMNFIRSKPLAPKFVVSDSLKSEY